MSLLHETTAPETPSCPCCGAEVSPLDLIIDETKGDVLYNGGTARFTRLEMRLFKALVAAFPRVMPKSDLYRAVSLNDDPDGGPEPKIVDVVLCKLRKKLGPLGLSRETQWGIGSKLMLDADAAAALARQRRFSGPRVKIRAPDAGDTRMIALFRARGWPLTDVARRLHLTFREVAAVYDRLDSEERQEREKAFERGAVCDGFAAHRMGEV